MARSTAASSSGPGMDAAVSRRMLVCAAALGAFAGVTLWATLGGRPAFDHDVLESVFQNRSEALEDAMLVLARASGVLGVTLLSVCVAVVLLLRRRFADAVFFAAAAAGSGLLVVAGKALFREPRPTIAEPLGPAGGFSYPSGHALSTMAVLAALLVVVPPGRARLAVLLGGGALVVAVGVSRIVLFAHYPSDVLAGWSLAIAWVAALAAVRAWRQERAG